MFPTSSAFFVQTRSLTGREFVAGTFTSVWQ